MQKNVLVLLLINQKSATTLEIVEIDKCLMTPSIIFSMFNKSDLASEY